MSRERQAPPRGDATDVYFDAVFGHQRALADVDRRRAERLAALSRALGLLENADRDAIATALVERLRAAGVASVRAEIVAGEGADVRLEAWYAAVVAPPGERARHADMIDTRFSEVEERVEVSFRPPIDAAAVQPALREVRALLRDAEATRRCTGRLMGALAPVLTRGAELRAAAPRSLWPAFAEAESVVLGVRPRAALHAQESTRIERWMLGVLQPEETESPTPTDEPH